jgi:DNA transformation protein
MAIRKPSQAHSHHNEYDQFLIRFSEMSNDFIDYLTDVLAPLGCVRSKRMFGGIGVYIDDLFCAIIVDDFLYFKGDDDNEDQFSVRKCPAFTYEKNGTNYSMRYYRVPDEALDDAGEMLRWAKLGMAAALRKAAPPKSRSTKRLPPPPKKAAAK